MVYSKFESLSVNGRMEISENILIDNKFQSGDYIMFVKIIKGNSIGISSDEFSVVGFVSIKGISSSLSDIFSKDNMVLLIFILLVFLVLIGLIVYLIRERDLIAGWSRYYLTGSRLKRDVREQKDDEFSTLRHKIGHNKINKYLK
jgi:hypothetical protein